MYKKIKQFIFFLAIMIAFMACQEQDDQESINAQNDLHSTDSAIENVNANDIPTIINHIAYQQSNFLPQFENQSSVNSDNNNPFGTVDLDHIQALINNENAEDKTYTFAITPHSYITDSFANLIVRVTNGIIVRSYIINYTPTDSYRITHGLSFDSHFSGTIEKFFLEETTINSSSSFTNSLETLTPVTSHTLNDGTVIESTTNCEPVGDTDNTDDTGNSGETGDPTSGNDDTGSSEPSGGSGNGGSEHCYDVITYVGCCSKNFCTPHAPEFNGGSWCTGNQRITNVCGLGHQFTGGTASSTSFNTDSSEPCPNDDVIVIPVNNQDPCKAINDYRDTMVIDDALDNLKASVNANQTSEKGYEVSMNDHGEVTTAFKQGGFDGVRLAHGGSIIGGMHTHTQDGIPFFSGDDVYKLANYFSSNTNSNKKVEDVFSMVVVNLNGNTETFAISINSFPVFRTIATQIGLEGLKREMNNIQNRVTVSPSLEKYAGGLLKLFKRYEQRYNLPVGSSINLFKLNNSGNFDKVELNSNNQIETNPCPTT